jgi:gluconokinase/shikimate kinase
MGVTGSGKTTVGAMLAERLSWPFQEGDLLHPQSSIDKMASGHPLTDEDRGPWLEKIARWVEQRLDSCENGVITCSALKLAYRDRINRRGSGIVFVFLSVSKQIVRTRLTARHDHFMPPSLLDSQFADLEEPTLGEPAIRVDATSEPAVIADYVVRRLALKL